ncbi:hypothetical protein JVU11DRAFT_190 [Chiua virens]|nr:hypothetical protein JVU11DRAFT_190 [Chiua virens]
MADADTCRLCTQIIGTHFGPLTAKVASALLTRGRLSLPQLVRFTGMKPRTVRASILMLVQHNILWHAHTDDEGEMLEFNTLECLLRLRFGRYAWLAESLFGQSGAEIVQIVLDHGKLRPPDILSRLSRYNPKSASMYSQSLYKLVSESYLKPSTILSHNSPRDKRIKYEAEEKARISGFPTARELREAMVTAGARLRREEAAAEKVGLKRKPKEQPSGRTSKKNKVTEEVVDDEVYFRVNFDKFNIHIRNRLIESAVEERFNHSAAVVMRATLKATESKQMSVSEIRSDPTSIAAIGMHIADDENLTEGLVTGTKKPSDSSLTKEYLGLLACADNPTPVGKAASYVSLSGNKINVEFDTISKRLGRRVLEAVTRERHGDDGVRIVRLLLDVGKMDEKHIAKVAMMANKDVRPLLSALSSEYLISTQEVPRSTDRNPTRTFYLWHVDLTNAYSALLVSFYKTLFNIGARRQAEREEPNVKAVLTKRERTDVAQDANLLTRMEREVLAEWERKREMLNVLEMRVEEAVFILRDLELGGSLADHYGFRTPKCPSHTALSACCVSSEQYLRTIPFGLSCPVMTTQGYAIHVDVEGTPLPPHPGPGWTRFVCISDTHSHQYRVPSGDVLLHAGDLSSWGHSSQLTTTIEWLKSLDHPVKIIVAGNHDLCLDQEWASSKTWADMIEQTRAYVHSQVSFGLYYLEHEPLYFTAPTGRVWKVYGSPAAPFYVQGAFQYESEAEAQAIYDRIPNDTEILITHTPPYRILDKTRRGKYAGCETLLSRLKDLSDCRLHVFGHIHEAAGSRVDEVGNPGLFRVSVNAAMERTRSATVVDLRN